MEIKEEKTTSSHLLSEEIKWIIVHYKKLGFSDSETAEIVKSSFNRPTLSRQSVKIIWNKYCNTAKVDNLWNKIGRPSILTEEDFEELEIFFKKKIPRNQ